MKKTKQKTRKTKQKNVTQILNMTSKQISNMSDKQLRAITVIANSAANKRIKRVEKAGLSSAVIDRAKKQGKFSVKGITDRTQLEAEFTRVRQFLSAQTSNVAGIKKQHRNMFKELANIVNPEMSKEEKIHPEDMTEVELQNVAKLIWKQIDKLAEDKALGITAYERYQIAAHAYKVTTRSKRPIHTKRSLFNNLKKWYSKMYRQSLQDPGLPNMTPGEKSVEEAYNGIT